MIPTFSTWLLHQSCFSAYIFRLQCLMFCSKGCGNHLRNSNGSYGVNLDADIVDEVGDAADTAGVTDTDAGVTDAAV